MYCFFNGFLKMGLKLVFVIVVDSLNSLGFTVLMLSYSYLDF